MKYVVASVDEIPEGGRKIVDVANRSIGIFNIKGEYFGLRNVCPHQGFPLCRGSIWGRLTSDLPGVFDFEPGGEILTCPHHGWEFEIRTGRSWCDPQRLRTGAYQVSVELGEQILEQAGRNGAAESRVEGPFVAETVPVTVEGQYLVLEVA